MSGPSDNRPPRGHRFAARVPATMELNDRSIPCSAVNLSRTGVLLVGRFTEPAAGRVDFTLRTQNGRLEVRLSGQVARVDQDPVNGETRVAIAFADMDSARRDALEIFLARLLESRPPGSLDGLKPGASPHEVKKALESIPLPQRIALAQRAELKQREFLRQDQHPAVLESLVRNSNFTLLEARALASSPFLQSGTIDALAGEQRFKDDEELRISLATHPRVSPPTAEKLTADFKAPQLRKLLARPGLNQLLREKLFRKLTRG